MTAPLPGERPLQTPVTNSRSEASEEFPREEYFQTPVMFLDHSFPGDSPSGGGAQLGSELTFSCEVWILPKSHTLPSFVHEPTCTSQTEYLNFWLQKCGCFYSLHLCFPDSSVGKESASKAGDPGLILGLGRSPGEGIGYPLQYLGASLVAQLVKNMPAMRETWIRSLGREDPLEKGKATHSSILAKKIPGTV